MELRKSVVTVALATAALAAPVIVYAASNSSSTTANTTASGTSKPWGGPRGFRHGPGHIAGCDLISLAASALGISQSTLMSDLKSGQSIVDVASTKSVSESSLISQMESALKTKLDAQISSGKLTSAQETKMLNGFSSHIKTAIEQKGLPSRPAGRWGHGGPMRGLNQEIAKLLNVTTQTLHSDVAAGQSIVQVAQTAGINEQTLISDLELWNTAQLNQVVANGKLTQSQATKMESQFASHVQSMIEQKGFPTRPHVPASSSGQPTVHSTQ